MQLARVWTERQKNADLFIEIWLFDGRRKCDIPADTVTLPNGKETSLYLSITAPRKKYTAVSALFSSASRLPSVPSAGGFPLLFGHFVGSSLGLTCTTPSFARSRRFIPALSKMRPNHRRTGANGGLARG